MNKALHNILTGLAAALLAALMVFSLAACSGKGGDSYTPGNTMDPNTTAVPVRDIADASRETNAAFTFTQVGQGANAVLSGGVLKITAGGEYCLSGRLDGRVLVEAGSGAEVRIILNNACITCGNEAPIAVITADKVFIRSEEGTYNAIHDTRKSESAAHDAAIYAECDLKLNGKGTLIVTAENTGGVKTKDDLAIKDVQLKVESGGTAVRGSDSVTVESGELLLISGKHGIKTSNSKVSGKGNQKGAVEIQSGSVTILAGDAAIDAAYNFALDPAGSVRVDIYTDGYAGFANNGAAGIKAQNGILINGGELNIFAGGDGLHADAGEKLENGMVSAGSVTIARGSVNITCGDDAVHAEGALTVSGGSVAIPESHEGFEGNVITILGGDIVINGSDDGINACKGKSAPLIRIAGGTLDVTAASGKSDAIDSNGDLVMTGGFAVVRCGAGGAAASVDVQGSVSVTGGTFIAVGRIADVPKAGGVNTFISSGTELKAGLYTANNAAGEELFIFSLSDTFNSIWIASDRLEQGGSYGIYNELLSSGAPSVEWTQSTAAVDNR